MKKTMTFGILASVFFAFTFILNRSMNLSGGYWIWSAVLRYLIMLPILYIIVKIKGGTSPIHSDIRKHPARWIIWSTVGFGLFYLPLTMASVYGESWFVAATWQLTIVAGVLLTPLFGKRIPIRNVLFSVIILIGIFLLQVSHFATAGTAGIAAALILILIAAFSYPLGNRKMMQYCPEGITTIQRVYGMTLCSVPFWIISGVVGFVKAGPPSGGQVISSAMVALFSGVVATLLFFEATTIVKNDPKKLAVIEATQSGEVIFTLIGGIIVLGDSLPTAAGWIGIAVVIIGMIGNSLCSGG